MKFIVGLILGSLLGILSDTFFYRNESIPVPENQLTLELNNGHIVDKCGIEWKKTVKTFKDYKHMQDWLIKFNNRPDKFCDHWIGYEDEWADDFNDEYYTEYWEKVSR